MESFLDTSCLFCKMTKKIVSSCNDFVCSKDKDIHKFFHEEFEVYSNQLLGKSYCFVTHDNKMVSAFTVANSSVRVDNMPKKKRNKLNRKIPFSKQRSQYPAVLVGQLVVFDEFSGMNLGCEVLDFIKAWFINPLNKTGCRYVIVDATNNQNVLNFYKNNGFDFIFDSDEEEMNFLSRAENVKSDNIFRKTRLMYFDLMLLSKENFEN